MAVVRSEGAGSVVEVLVQPGDEIAEGDEVMVMESMKMEIPVTTPYAGTVKDIHVAVGDSVQEDDAIATIGAADEDGAS